MYIRHVHVSAVGMLDASREILQENVMSTFRAILHYLGWHKNYAYATIAKLRAVS